VLNGLSLVSAWCWVSDDASGFILSNHHHHHNDNKMPPLHIVRAANAKFSPSSPPVAIFVGGTAGIGRAMAEGFARYTKGNAHIIICGRNREVAEGIIAGFPKPSAAEGAEPPVHEFVQCDATLMKNVHATTKELVARLPKLNYLVQSPGYLTMRGRDETEEGLDKKMALNYYARWTFAHDLMPLLRNAKDAGEEAKVFSVLAAGKGGEIDLNDLGLKKTFTLANCASATPTYNDLMNEVRLFLFLVLVLKRNNNHDHRNSPFNNRTSRSHRLTLV
jgi:NAD(P)-dependent dehydrogenase (short-subunit alcohol dehydrogenase family)